MTRNTKGLSGGPSDDWKVELGKRITEARLYEGYRRGREFKQSELAEAVGVSALTISRNELGRKAPGRELIPKLARALNCDPGWLENGPPQRNVYAGRSAPPVAERADGQVAPSRPRRGRRARQDEVRGKLPRMWYGEPALTESPVSIRRRQA